MTLEILKSKEELRDLVDAYAYLGDEKRIAEVMDLFTPDAVYKVYMGGTLLATTNGIQNLERDFMGHAADVKTYFTLNGQHTVKIIGDVATGVSFSQIKMIREPEGKKVLTDYSVRYVDQYVRLNGKWLIKERTGHFVIIESRFLDN
ncbi:nuclear transport factor 2 family protein [Dyadobacter luteus]|uniref:Nuclear transport factor 2 family protein n=1 Tax=Dyadobacter luteus TaxID=2259619 RepID=A0A3D8Y936_9BACT|nr:nuclear transport factor 2 family protein [Dyadobacter luteus]REA58027.1 nuclear transport factor 2 family protein [Dyadobacter luteus]